MKRFVTVSARGCIAGVFAVALFSAALIAVDSAEASVLNVCWNGQGYTAIKTYSGSGAAPDSAANTTWNNVATTDHDTLTLTNLVFSDNTAATGVSIQLNGVYSFTPGGSPALNLFNGHINAATADTPSVPYVSLDVKGLDDSKKYDLYLYSARAAFSPDPTDFTVNDVTQSLAGSANTSSFVLGDNYVRFLQQSSTNGALNITFGGGAWGGVFSGMQVVGVTATPEPGTLAIGVTAVLAMAAYAWRKRN